MNAVLTVSNLRIIRAARVLLDDLSFTVDAGERLSLVGEPGSGRTTLFRLLSGTLPLPAGSIGFGGEGGEAPRAAFVPFAGSSDALLTVHDTLAAAARRAGWSETEADARATARLQEGGLGDDGHRLMGTIDYGTRRLVEILAALIADPELIVIDDPAEAVAPRAKEEIYRTLREAAERGAAVVQLTACAEDAELLGGRARIMPAPIPVHQETPSRSDRKSAVRPPVKVPVAA